MLNRKLFVDVSCGKTYIQAVHIFKETEQTVQKTLLGKENTALLSMFMFVAKYTYHINKSNPLYA